MHRYEVKTVSEFVRHLAVNYVSRGYFFYVKGEIPIGKDPCRVDAKIIERYGIQISKWQRHRRRRKGEASVHYLRCRHRFVIIATHGRHPFFEAEANRIRDLRRSPLQFGGYSIGYWQRFERAGVSVRISSEHLSDLREYLRLLASRVPSHEVEAELRRFAFPNFAPVCRQIGRILKEVNLSRVTQGLEEIEGPFAGRFRIRHQKTFT